MNNIRSGLALLLGLLSTPALAVDQASAAAIVQASLSSSLDAIFTDLQGMAIKWLFIMITLQFFMTNYKLLLDGSDIGVIVAKAVGAVGWAGICLYIFDNGPSFIKNTAGFFLAKAAGMAGQPFDGSFPIYTGIRVTSNMLTAVDKAQSVLGSFNPFPSIMMGVISVVVLATATVIAFKVFMIFIETKIVIALSPLSFAFLGLNALRDQGLIPLKYLISMIYRTLILSAILAAMVKFSDAIIASMAALPDASDPSIWPPLWAAAMGYLLLGGLAWRADSIAAMLSSGSTQMTTGDAAAAAFAGGGGRQHGRTAHQQSDECGGRCRK